MDDSENPLHGQICVIHQCRIHNSGKDCIELRDETKKDLEGSQVEFTEDGCLRWKLKNGLSAEDNAICIYNRYDVEKEEESDKLIITFYNDKNSTWYYGNVALVSEGHGNTGSRIELHFENFTLLVETEKVRSAGLYEDNSFHLLNVLEEQQFTDFDIIDKKGGKADRKCLISDKFDNPFVENQIDYFDGLHNIEELQKHTEQHSAHRVVLQSRLNHRELEWLNLQSQKVIKLVLHFCYADCLPRDVSLDQLKSCHKTLNESLGFHALQERIQAYLAKHETKQRLTNVLATSERLAKEIVQLLMSCQIRDCRDVSLLVENIKQIIRLGLSSILHLIVFNHTFHKNKRKLDREERKELLVKFIETLFGHVEQLGIGTMRLNLLTNQFISLDEQHKEDLVGQSLVHLHEYHTLAHSLVFKGMDIAKRRKNAKLSNLKHVKLLYSKNLNNLSELMVVLKKKLPYIESKVTKFRACSTTEQVQRVTVEGRRLVCELDNVVRTCERLPNHFDTDIVSLKSMKKRMRRFTQREGYIVSYLADLMRHDAQFEALVMPLIKFVDRADFNACLAELSILPKDAASPADLGTLCGAYSLTEPPGGKSNGLADALGKLLASKNEDLCDLTLVVEEEDRRREFHLHRAVAGGRCQWLNRALQSGMREAIERRIVIRERNADAMELAIGYMYTGKIDVTEVAPTTIMDLISVADQFEMQTLSRVCADCLRRQYVNEDTAATLLLFADRLQLADLRTTCLDFIQDNSSTLATDQNDLLATDTAKSLLEEAAQHPRLRPSPSLSDTETRGDEVTGAEQVLLTGDEERLNSTMTTIRDISGLDPYSDRESWTQCILAADYDIHRALNYYLDQHS